MFLNILLFYSFATFAIISSILVVLATNPVFSVLFLILSFFNISALSFMIEFEFLPIVLLIIYVGAIAVLFLFIIMMLNIKISELKENSIQYIPAILIFSILFFINVSMIIQTNFQNVTLENTATVYFLKDFINTFDNQFDFTSWVSFKDNLENIGAILFTNYFFDFILSGIILLLAMIGAIILTLHKKFTNKSQNIYSQITRDLTKTVVLYK